MGDITAFWNITEAATLRVGVFNVTDEKYWWWSDVRGLTGTPAVLDSYSQPGRNYSASISYRF
ncbi:MAG: TonB-dependent receptor [Terricaulis sp.]|nr:TonB-dependent receptor [Terricaulis sp.]